MPTHALVQVAYDWDSALPRDRFVMNPCFRWANFTIQDAESLANNVLDAFGAAYPTQVVTHQVAKVYDLEGTPPVLPMATVERGVGLLRTSSRNREIALCLSFKGGPGAPRNRGRLYIPGVWTGNEDSVRPTAAVANDALILADKLFNVGGANVDWIVWSRRARAATGINHAWVDDEWDTQRRRGLRATTRWVKDF